MFIMLDLLRDLLISGQGLEQSYILQNQAKISSLQSLRQQAL